MAEMAVSSGHRALQTSTNNVREAVRPKHRRSAVCDRVSRANDGQPMRDGYSQEGAPVDPACRLFGNCLNAKRKLVCWTGLLGRSGFFGGVFLGYPQELFELWVAMKRLQVVIRLYAENNQ
jgi:hypothetical protein